uniref:Uncharacterized protein n=1 Tax=Anopheles maculatus TaxID=74869 RepID=A0A182SVZ0_9DIPT
MHLDGCHWMKGGRSKTENNLNCTNALYNYVFFMISLRERWDSKYGRFRVLIVHTNTHARRSMNSPGTLAVGTGRARMVTRMTIFGTLGNCHELAPMMEDEFERPRAMHAPHQFRCNHSFRMYTSRYNRSTRDHGHLYCLGTGR